MSEQIKITSYNLFRTKIMQINEWKQVNVFFAIQIEIVDVLLFFLSTVLEFLDFMASLVLFSYRLVSFQKGYFPYM